MSARWVFVILACCRLSHASEPEECKDRLKTLCVSAGENVSVPCPMIKTEGGPMTYGREVTYNLFQSGELVYNHTCDRGACTKQHTSNLRLHENTENNSVSFVLSAVNASDHGVYRCKTKVSYPPPFKTNLSDLIVVLVKGHQCKITPEISVTAAEQYSRFYWIFILAFVTLYGIIATIIAVYNLVRLRRTDSQSDYMNTKPKPVRDRRKKRGVPNLFPRHF